MKILLTNDDGIDAPGLTALAKVTKAMGEVSVVAPKKALSGCSHLTTTRRPVAVEKLGEGRYAVDGSPADCVRLGLLHLAPDAQCVISGINDGANLGVDVYMSGTAAACREAAFYGYPATALSQYRRQPAIDWDLTAQWASRVLNELIGRSLAKGAFWNVNFPAPEDWPREFHGCEGKTVPPAIRDCPLDTHPLHIEYRKENEQYIFCGQYRSRQRSQGSDVDVCFGGEIAVSQVHLIATG